MYVMYGQKLSVSEAITELSYLIDWLMVNAASAKGFCGKNNEKRKNYYRAQLLCKGLGVTKTNKLNRVLKGQWTKDEFIKKLINKQNHRFQKIIIIPSSLFDEVRSKTGFASVKSTPFILKQRLPGSFEGGKR